MRGLRGTWPTDLFGKTLTDRLFYAWPYRLPRIGPTLTTPWEVALLDPVPRKDEEVSEEVGTPLAAR